MATTTTIQNLPPQPLPSLHHGYADSICVTIWWVASVGFAFHLCWLLCIPYSGVNWLVPRSRPTLDIFRIICLATGILAVWYFFLMIDRWLHHTQRPCAYGYIVFVTLFESLQALSAVIFTWGNYRVVWLEMETRFSEVWQNRLWKAGRAALLLVSLFSINYVLLSVAHASVWLKFYRLNSTAYVATITTAFEITTAALLMIFALLTCVTASYTLLYQAKKCDGRSNNAWKNRWLLPAALFLFFLRCALELGFLHTISSTQATRESMNLTRDVSYGLLSFLYLLAIAIYASMLSSPDDMGKADTQDIRTNVRHYIDEKLNEETEEASKTARPFLDIVDDIETAFKDDFGGIKARFYAGSNLSDEANRKTIENYFQQLRSDYGYLGSPEDMELPLTSPYQSTTSLLSTIGSIRHKVFGAASDPSMRTTFKKAWNRSRDFQSGRKSAPPTMPGQHENEPGSGHAESYDPLMSDTATIWSRTDNNVSRQGSLNRGHRYSSAPDRPLATLLELQSETNPRDSRIFSDPTASSSGQGRYELAGPEPPSPPGPGYEQGRRPGYPPGLPRMQRQRPHASYRDRLAARDGGWEMESYQPYHPGYQAAAGPSNPSPVNLYALRTRSIRRKRTASETGGLATPYLQQATPHAPSVNRQYTATPDPPHEQRSFPPSVPTSGTGNQYDNVSDIPPPQAIDPPPITELNAAESLLQAQAATSTGPTRHPETPPRTMQFAGARNRRAAARQAASSS